MLRKRGLVAPGRQNLNPRVLALGAGGQLGVARTTVFWMVAAPEQLVAAGVGVRPFAVDPASLLGWHHTLHEFSHEFRPIACGARRLAPSGRLLPLVRRPMSEAVGSSCQEL